MSAVLDFVSAFRQAGRGLPIVRQQYRLGDRVLAKTWNAVGVFDRYETTGKVRLFIRGSLQVFDQASVEPAGTATEIPVYRMEVSR